MLSKLPPVLCRFKTLAAPYGTNGQFYQIKSNETYLLKHLHAGSNKISKKNQPNKRQVP